MLTRHTKEVARVAPCDCYRDAIAHVRDKVIGIGDNGSMVSKVVLGECASGRAGLRIAPIISPLPSRTPPGTELHLGSQDLIRLAAYAETRNFLVSSFLLADGYLAPLPDEEQIAPSDQMVDALHFHGVEELEASMQDEHDGLYVVGVTLISSTGMRVTVKRRGFVETSVLPEAEDLLRSAWQELRLS